MMRSSMIQMDTHPTPPPPGFFKGRIQKSKYMDYRKNTEDSKTEGDVDGHLQNLKQKRVFGTQRNTNVAIKAKTEKKSAPKQLKSVEKTPLKSSKPEISQKDEPSTDKEAEQNADAQLEPEVIERANKDDEDEEKPIQETEVKVKPKKKMKNVGFQEKLNFDDETSVPRTPIQLSSSLRKPKKKSLTPYHTAQNCKRCFKVDKLETSTYWLEQIKLAESVGKHFASAAFFHLAHKSNAEPSRSLKMELKRYLTRHGELSNQNEWIEALRRYGLHVPKDADDDDDGRSGCDMKMNNLKLDDDESNGVTCNHHVSNAYV